MRILEGIKPERVFHYFEEISKIPRRSGNEGAIADYCIRFAKERGLFGIKDEHNNVLIKKPGASGKENNPAVILQGHLDMVCVKNAGVRHDFTKDPIRLRLKGDDISAEGTTLGADNGIAVAMILAALEEREASHPPLECLLTSMEETGLEGASKFDYKCITGKYLINLDGERYGEITVSCAGGLRTEISLPLNLIDSVFSEPITLAIRIRGLLGGHSGADIHLERANANKLIGRLLDWLHGKAEYEICEISGGSADNAIPRESEAYINVNAQDVPALEKYAADFEALAAEEYKLKESGITVKCDREQTRSKVFCKETAQKAIALIMAVPDGIMCHSPEIEGLVESSNNLGIIRAHNNSLVLTCAARSSEESRKEYTEAIIKNLAQLSGASFCAKSRYPGWRYDSLSELRKIACRVFMEQTGQELKAGAIHAGLECGIIKERLPEADAISMGPDMWDVHTPQERLSASSTEKTYNFLLRLLEEL